MLDRYVIATVVSQQRLVSRCSGLSLQVSLYILHAIPVFTPLLLHRRAVSAFFGQIYMSQLDSRLICNANKMCFDTI